MIVDIAQTDIVRLAVDAIVNAANASLLGGGGVDGAIHRAAGPRLLAACRDLPETRQGVRCPTGEARLTPGFDLPARYVVHTVGPVWRGGGHGEARLLAACYAHCLRLAREHAVASIAFPAISAGIYGYPMDDAARIAVDTVLTAPWRPEAVIFCTFSAAATRAYRAALDASGQRG